MGTASSVKFLTLADWAKRVDPKGGIDTIVELLSESNPMIQDASVIMGNLPTGHRHTERTTVASGTWRLLNKGVAETRTTTEQKDDQCGMLEAFSAIDADLVSLAGNAAAFRLSEDMGFISGLSNDAETAIISANALTDPEKMHGFLPRYNLTTGTPGSTQVIDGAGTTALTSVWLITWGPKLNTLIFPQGSQAGLKTEDLGNRPWDDSSGNPYMAWVTHYQWKLGLAVHDYRYVVRICNIGSSALTTDASTGVDLMEKMVKAYFRRGPTEGMSNLARTFWYCNKTVAEYLSHQAANKSNVYLNISNPAGEPIMSFYGIPIHICDQIGVAETEVS